VGTLLPLVARGDVERRVVVNTIGPVWEGNQVWLILGGGAIFAAWPQLYAVSFSGFYMAMFAVLFALTLRPVGFKYRSARESARWRNGWDWALFIVGFVPSLIFGVAMGNVLQGVPFRITPDIDVLRRHIPRPAQSVCPLVRSGVAYTSWVFSILRGKVRADDIRSGNGHAY